MKKLILSFLSISTFLPIPSYAGIKIITNTNNETFTQERVNQVQAELDRKFVQLLGMLDQGNQKRMIENEQEWQQGLNNKIAKNPANALLINYQDTVERVCVIERIIQQIKEKESCK